MDSAPSYEWRGAFENTEVNRLHAECFDHKPGDCDWQSRLDRYSLGWVCARDDGRLIGFVNVVWDGGKHAFVVDLMVTKGHRHGGFATNMMRQVLKMAGAAGCEWLHVDFEEALSKFYLNKFGFRMTSAGLIRLSRTSTG